MGKLETNNVISPYPTAPSRLSKTWRRRPTHSFKQILDISSKQLKAYLGRCLVEISITPESARCTSCLPKNHGEGPFQWAAWRREQQRWQRRTGHNERSKQQADIETKRAHLAHHALLDPAIPQLLPGSIRQIHPLILPEWCYRVLGLVWGRLWNIVWLCNGHCVCSPRSTYRIYRRLHWGSSVGLDDCCPLVESLRYLSRPEPQFLADLVGKNRNGHRSSTSRISECEFDQRSDGQGICVLRWKVRNISKWRFVLPLVNVNTVCYMLASTSEKRSQARSL